MRRLLFDALRWSLFPAILGTALIAAWSLARAGWSEMGVVFVVAGTAGVALLALQRVLPARRDWQRWKPDAGVDVLHLLFSTGGAGALAAAAFSGGLFAASAWFSETLGASVWPVALPVAAQLVLALVIAELPTYWWHRLSHTWGPLWRLHALHHSSERLYLLSSGRTHPVHVAGTWLAQMGTLALLGAPAEVLLLMSVFTPVHGFLQHANIDLLLFPFNRVFATVDLHRWHHSTVLAEGNANYGNNLVIWDHVFGTWLLPKDRATPEAVGLSGDVAFPRDYVRQLASPLNGRLFR